MFHYKSIDEVREAAAKQQVSLPFAENAAVLKEKLVVGGKEIPNRMAIQPMEGCDGTADGKPGELTLRRYDKAARGSSGRRPPPSGRRAAPIPGSCGSMRRAWTR